MVLLEELIKIFSKFGILEKRPKSKKHLDYDTIDLKSRRILNRLASHLTQRGKELLDLFSDIVVEQTVRTKTRQEKVEIIRSEQFFIRLAQLGLKRTLNKHKNLSDFLCIDKSYENSLMLKKLKRAIQDCQNSQYISLTGLKKKKASEL